MRRHMVAAFVAAFVASMLMTQTAHAAQVPVGGLNLTPDGSLSVYSGTTVGSLEATASASSGAVTVLGMSEDPGPCAAGQAGTIEVLQQVGNTWTPEQRIQSPAPVDASVHPGTRVNCSGRFGQSVAIDGSELAVSSAAATSDSGATQGAVFLFGQINGSWALSGTLAAPTGYAVQQVAVSGGRLAVDAMDASGHHQIFTYAQTGTSWTSDGDFVGSGPLALNGDTLVYGYAWNGSGPPMIAVRGVSGWVTQFELGPQGGVYDTPGGVPVPTGASYQARAIQEILTGTQLVVLLGLSPPPPGTEPTDIVLYNLTSSGWTFSGLIASTAAASFAGASHIAVANNLVWVTVPDGQGSGAVYQFSQASDGSWSQSATLTSPVVGPVGFGAAIAASGGVLGILANYYNENFGAWFSFDSTATLTGSINYPAVGNQAGLGGSVAVSGTLAVSTILAPGAVDGVNYQVTAQIVVARQTTAGWIEDAQIISPGAISGLEATLTGPIATDGTYVYAIGQANPSNLAEIVQFVDTGTGWSIKSVTPAPNSNADVLSYLIRGNEMIMSTATRGTNYSAGVYAYERTSSGWTRGATIQSPGSGLASVAENRSGTQLAVTGSGSNQVFISSGSPGNWALSTSLALPSSGSRPAPEFDDVGDLAVIDPYGPTPLTFFATNPTSPNGFAAAFPYDPPSPLNQFATSVSGVGTAFLVPQEDLDAVNQVDVFQQTSSGWAVVSSIPSPSGQAWDQFGQKLSSDGHTLEAGASGLSSPAGATTGALYFYDLSQATVPAPPIISGVQVGDHSATVTWLKPADGGSPITGYTVTAAPGGQSCSTSGADALTCTITGLTNGVNYTFTVTAQNATGPSAPGTGSGGLTVGAPPGPPVVLPPAPNPSDGTQVTISWLAAQSDPNLPVIGYAATATPGGQSCATTGSLSCTITGLTAGQAYTFTVVAINGVGSSPVTRPSAPTTVTVTAGTNGQAVLAWAVPPSTGGSPITGYVASLVSGVGGCISTGVTTCTVGGLTPGSTYTFTVTATNNVGTSDPSVASSAFTVPVPPTVSVMGVTAGTSYEFGGVPAATCQTSDAVDGASSFAATLSAAVGPRGSAGLGTVTASCAFTDTLGLNGAASTSYVVVDTTGPSVSVPNLVSVAASAPSTPVPFTVTAVDLVDGVSPVSCDHASGSGFGVGTTTVTCTATDIAGNTASASFPVTVSDSTPPAITVPASLTASATGAVGAVVTYPPVTAVDRVDGSVLVTCNHPSGATYPLGSTTVTCTATDASNNTTTASFTVTVQNTTAPVVTVPTAVRAEAPGPAGAAVTYTGVSAKDVVDGTITATCNHSSGATYPLGSTTVTCTAKDKAGNVGSSTFTVTVVDTTAPVLTVPGHLTVQAAGPLGTTVSYPAPTAVDLVDGAITPVCTNATGDQFGLGDTIVSCTATDKTGNTATATFTITVVDTTPPVLTVPGSQRTEATGPRGAPVNYPAAAAVDTVDGPVPATCIPESGTTFPLGITTVTCTATDAHTNKGTATFTVTVIDTTPPTLTVPANQTVQATSPFGALVTYPAPTATDLVDSPITPVCDHASGSTFPSGLTTVTCAATDKSGNKTTATFMITVAAGIPLITVPATITAEATGPTGAKVTYPPVTATDTQDGTLTAACSPTSGSVFALGSTTVTCKATNKAGVTGTGTFTVKVKDTTGPVLTKVANLLVYATSSKGRTVTYIPPTATDQVDGTRPVTCTPPSGNLFPVGTTAVTCTAVDKSGNTATTKFTITVRYSCQHVSGDDLKSNGRYQHGSRVRIELALTGDSTPITNAPAHLWAQQLSSTTGAGVTLPTTNATPTVGNTFRYDPTTHLYIFDLDTTLLDPGVWQLHLDLADGNPITDTITITH